MGLVLVGVVVETPAVSDSQLHSAAVYNETCMVAIYVAIKGNIKPQI